MDDLVALVEKVESDGPSLDLVAASHLNTILLDQATMEGKLFYQTCIKAVLVDRRPVWAKLMRAGRQRFVDGLSQDQRDVFAGAGLMRSQPEVGVVRWWDDVSGHARLAIDLDKMEQAREAELLTLNYERERLACLGITEEPKWPGLDDNYAGYDVLSYELGEHGVVNRMIEVKSTVASPLRFVITRNEWSQARAAESSYLFHVWDMAASPERLYVRKVKDISPHMPTDNGKGQWRVAEIPLGGL